MFCDSIKVNYLNLSDFQKEINLEFNDFRDINHPNTIGSSKISNYIKKITICQIDLKKKFGLKK